MGLSIEKTNSPITLSNKTVAPPPSSPPSSLPETESTIYVRTVDAAHRHQTQHARSLSHCPSPSLSSESQDTEEQRNRPAGSDRDGGLGQAGALTHPHADLCLIYGHCPKGDSTPTRKEHSNLEGEANNMYLNSRAEKYKRPTAFQK